MDAAGSPDAGRTPRRVHRLIASPVPRAATAPPVFSCTLTRRVTFAAAHRYRRPQWSDARNAEVFGLCARPSFHGHTYVCDVSVRAPIDAVTGFVVDLGVLDRILASEVRERFDHRNINTDVADFADGQLIPSGENLARYIFEKVQAALGNSAEVTAVRVAEDDTLSATYSRD